MGINDILDIWKDDETAEIQHKDLIEKIITLKEVQRRQAERYLAILKAEEKLETIRKGPKNTFYKPTTKGWNNYLWLKQQTQQLCEYVADSLDQTISETKQLNARLNSRLWEQIGASPECELEENSTDAFDRAMTRILHDEPSKKEIENFYRQYDLLLQSCLKPLTDHTVFSRLLEDEELPDVIKEQVSGLVHTFMDTWDFIYKHPKVVSELEKILEPNQPLRQSARRIVHHKRK